MKEDDNTKTHFTLTEGTMVAHYRIVKKIGAGGMGEVYLAGDTTLKRNIALKFMPSYLASNAELNERFMREARAAAKLDHPNIIQVYEVGDFQGRPFIAMAHIEGESLQSVIKKGELSITESVKLVMQICEGLGEAHRAEIVHRDIKPGNIILDRKGRVRILDFGLATVAGEDKLTKVGSTLGTAAYMAPEQIEGKQVDQRADIFALGVILYEMLTGKRPFDGNNDTGIAHAITQTEPEPIARYKSGTTQDLQRIIDKALSKDPTLRYQNAGDMLTDLKRLEQSESAPRKKKPKKYATYSIVAILIIVLVILKPWKFEVTLNDEVAARDNTLAIMYFDNINDPADTRKFGEIASNLLITDLSESEYVEVVSSQRLYDILRSLGHEGEKRIDKSLAREVAQKSNSRWMLLGSILQSEPTLVITSQLVDVESGTAIASQRINVRDDDNIFTIVDSLSVEIKKDLSLPEQAFLDKRPINSGFTESAEAYKCYLEGWEAIYKLDYRVAVKEFQEAVRIDSTFTLAYFGLSLTAPDNETQYNAVSKVLENIDDVNEVDRQLMLARKAQLDGDREKSIEEIEKYLKLCPNSKDGWFWLGSEYKPVDVNKAIECLNRAIEIDPNYKMAHNLLAYTYNELGEFDKSIAAINKYIEIAPDEANPYDTRGEIYALNGHLDIAIKSYETALSNDSNFIGTIEKLPSLYVLNRQYDKAEILFRRLITNPDAKTRAIGRRYSARIPMHQGKFMKAIQALDSGIEADKLENGESIHVAEKYWIRSIINGLHRKDYETGILDVSKAISIRDSLNPKDSFIPHLMANMARFYSAKGDYEIADSVARMTKTRIEQNGSSNFRNYDLARALVALEKGEYENFLALWKQHANSPFFASDYLMALAYYGSGQIGEAVHLLESTLNYYDGNRANWPATSVKARYLLAKCYEASNWNKKAIEEYEVFLEIWENADEGIPEVQDARERLAKLKQTI